MPSMPELLKVPLDTLLAILANCNTTNQAEVGPFKICGCDPFGSTKEARDPARRLRGTEQPVAYLHLPGVEIGGRGQYLQRWVCWESPYAPVRFEIDGSEYTLCIEGEGSAAIEQAAKADLSFCDYG